MPEETLEATAALASVGAPQRDDGGDCEAMLAKISAAGIDVAGLGAQLQIEGRDSFDKSWADLLKDIEKKSAAVAAS